MRNIAEYEVLVYLMWLCYLHRLYGVEQYVICEQWSGKGLDPLHTCSLQKELGQVTAVDIQLIRGPPT